MATGRVVDLQWVYLVVGHLCYNSNNNNNSNVFLMFWYRYVGCIASNEADKMLKDLFDGTYFIREKKESKRNYEICIK